MIRISFRHVLLALLLAATPVARAGDGKQFEVKAVTDLAYYDGQDADKVKHKLDLYLPQDHKDFPVVLFVHGGGWTSGDKNYFGMYSAMGRHFARCGYGAVVTNYRLSPGVQHPCHVQDVARAFAWTRKHIKEYGGLPEQLFVCGHSAGGHLVSLLSTDDSYLKAEGCSTKNIKGCISLSGVYLMRDKGLENVFGTDPEARKQAFPMAHVREDLPPFLILYADGDFPLCDRMSEEFCKALKTKKCTAEVCEIKERNHMSILARSLKDDDPCWQAMFKFLEAQTKK